jgi:ADP-heptose:LPS heptosyltransferase
MEIVPDEDRLEWAEGYLKARGLSGGGFVAVLPGGGASWGSMASRKRWDAGSFSKLCEMISQKIAPVAILGDAKEKELCAEVAAGMSAKPAFTETALSLKDYIALLSKSRLVVCNDGGPLHIAVALGLRTVSIFGPVDDKVYGPYPVSPRHRVVTAAGASCRPCYNRFKLPVCERDNVCLAGITPDEVFAACVDVMSK